MKTSGQRMGTEASWSCGLDDAAKKTDVIGLSKTPCLLKWVLSKKEKETNLNKSCQGNRACFFHTSSRATRRRYNVKLRQIHFGCLKLSKLIRPRLLSVSRKLWFKKVTLIPLTFKSPVFWKSYVLRSKSKSKTHVKTNTTFAAQWIVLQNESLE